MNLGGAAAVPGRKQHAAPSTFMLDVLERVHNVGNASEAAETAEAKSPSMGGVSCFKRSVRHGTLSARRAVSRRRATTETRDRSGVLVYCAARLLWGHTRLLSVGGLRVCALGLLRGW